MSSNIRVNRICQHCGKDFIAKTTVTKFCGDDCAKKSYKLRDKQYRAKYKGKLKDAKIKRSEAETLSIINRPIEELKAKEFLSISETAELTGISVRTVQRLIERGSLKAGKLGSRTIVHKKQLEKLFL